MIGSLNNITLSGIQSGLNKLQKNVEQIAAAINVDATGEQSLFSAVVDIKANVLQVNASMKALDISDKIIGTILDIKA